MKDYDVQADIAIALTTSDFEEDAMLFGSRNAVMPYEWRCLL